MIAPSVTFQLVYQFEHAGRSAALSNRGLHTALLQKTCLVHLKVLKYLKVSQEFCISCVVKWRHPLANTPITAAYLQFAF